MILFTGGGACPGGVGVRAWGEHAYPGACVPRTPPPERPDTMRYGRSMGGQYASYWNAFLLNLVTKFFAENDVLTWDVLVFLNLSHISPKRKEIGRSGDTEYRV